jgi:ankyrin repeat protein
MGGWDEHYLKDFLLLIHEKGDVEDKKLINMNVHVNSPLLFYAIKRNKFDLVKFLLELDADPKVKNVADIDAFDVAIDQKNWQALCILNGQMATSKDKSKDRIAFFPAQTSPLDHAIDYLVFFERSTYFETNMTLLKKELYSERQQLMSDFFIGFHHVKRRFLLEDQEDFKVRKSKFIHACFELLNQLSPELIEYFLSSRNSDYFQHVKFKLADLDSYESPNNFFSLVSSTTT